MQQVDKGKGKVQEEDPDDEIEREFELSQHEEPEHHHTHHGVEVIEVENLDEASEKNLLLLEKDAHIQC